jgi:hypothetical protein
MRNIIISVVLAVLVIGGGAAAYFFVFNAPAAPKIVEFIGQPQRVLAEGDAVDAPHDGAAVVARLPKDMMVDAVGVVEGGKWTQVTLPDKRTAYFTASGLGAKPADAAPSMQMAAQPQSTATTPAPTSSPTDTGSPATSSPPPAQPAAPPVLEDSGTVEFDAIASVYSVAKTVPVYIEPNVHAPQKYQIEAGTSVPAIQRSKDGVWIMASTEDGDPAYLLVADLGPEQPGKPVAGAGDSSGGGDQPDTVDGAATVVTTSDLQINGQDVVLAGITGESGSYAEQLQNLIAAQGGTVHCIRQDTGYQCKLANGLDLALSALYNGGARPTPDAPDTYQNQAKAAQAARRGVWAH